MNVIGDFDINDMSTNEQLKALNKDNDIYAINKELIKMLTYKEKEVMKNLLISFKNDTLKRKLWKLSDEEYDYYIENTYNVEIQKSKNNNTIYGVKLLEDNKLWFYTMGM